MIDALIHGRLIHCRQEAGQLVGRIVDDEDRPVHFIATRGRIKSTLQAMAQGMPLSVAGPLTTCVKHDKEGSPYVEHVIRITAVLTAQPKGLLGSIF